MREEVFSQFTGGHWMIATMFAFMIVFVVFAVWTFRKSGKGFYQRMARMPLDGGDNDE